MAYTIRVGYNLGNARCLLYSACTIQSDCGNDGGVTYADDHTLSPTPSPVGLPSGGDDDIDFDAGMGIGIAAGAVGIIVLGVAWYNLCRGRQVGLLPNSYF